MNPRCTICGRKCPQTVDGRGKKTGYSRFGRHVYGTFSEPRCSFKCMKKPVVDVEAQRTLVRMGDIVVNARLSRV